MVNYPIEFDEKIDAAATVAENKILINPKKVKNYNLENIILHEKAHLEIELDINKVKRFLEKLGFLTTISYSEIEIDYMDIPIIRVERKGWEYILNYPKKFPKIKKLKQIIKAYIAFCIAYDVVKVALTGSSEIIAEYYAAANNLKGSLHNLKESFKDFFKDNPIDQIYKIRYLLGFYIAKEYGDRFFDNWEKVFYQLLFEIEYATKFVKEFIRNSNESQETKGIFRRKRY